MLKKIVLGVCLVAVLALFASGVTAATPTREVEVIAVSPGFTGSTEGVMGYSLTITASISPAIAVGYGGTPPPPPYQGECYITLDWNQTMLRSENGVSPPMRYGVYHISQGRNTLPAFDFEPLAPGTSHIYITEATCTDQDGSAIPTDIRAGDWTIVVQPAPTPIPMDTPIPIPTAAWVPPVAVTTSVIITAPPTGSGGLLR